MNTNKFKTLLCIYAIGVAGCNKLGNPSYMMNIGPGGDKLEKEKEKTQHQTSKSNIDQSKVEASMLHSMESSLSNIDKSIADQKKIAQSANQEVDNLTKTKQEMRKAYNMKGLDKLNECSKDSIKSSLSNIDKSITDQKKIAEFAIQEVDNLTKTKQEMRKAYNNLSKTFQNT